MKKCPHCGKSITRSGLTFCDRSCATTYRNKNDNPGWRADVKEKLSTAGKRRNSQAVLMTPEARSKAIPKIAAALKGRSNTKNKGRRLSSETKRKISESLMGRFVGEKNGNWRGGTSARDWSSARYRRFVYQVRTQAKGHCERCGAKSGPGKMHVHHKQSWVEFPELRYEPTNGELLCDTCHYKTYSPPAQTEEVRKKLSSAASQRQRRPDGTFTKAQGGSVQT